MRVIRTREDWSNGQPVDVRLYSAAQQTLPNFARHARRSRCPNCPKSRPRAAASRRTSSAAASRSCIVYDRRLRWPVPADLAEKRRRAARSTRVDRRSKYLLFRLGADTLLVHLGMTGSLRVLRAARRRGAPHDHVDIVLDDGIDAALPRSAALRRDALAARPGDAHPLLARPRARAVRRRVRRRLPVARDRASRTAAIKLALMDNHLVVGVGNIYANESLFRAGIRPTTPRAQGLAAAARAAGRRGARRARRGDRQGRQHAARLRRRRRRARLLPARLLRLRPGGRALPGLRHRDPHAPAGRPRVVLLPAPASARRPARGSVRRVGQPAGVPPMRRPFASADRGYRSFRRHELCLTAVLHFARCPRRTRRQSAPPIRGATWSHPAISPPASRPTATGAAGCPPASPALHDWLQQQDLADAQVDLQGPAAARAAAPGQAHRRVRRRVLARQVRAHQRDLLRRLRPAAPALVGRAARRCARPSSSTTRRAPPSIRLLPIETRAEGRDGRRVQELRRRVGDVPARPVVGRPDERGAVARVAGEARAGRARAQVRPLRRRRGRHPRGARGTATKARSTSRAGATRSSTSRIRCCSRAS